MLIQWYNPRIYTMRLWVRILPLPKTRIYVILQQKKLLICLKILGGLNQFFNSLFWPQFVFMIVNKIFKKVVFDNFLYFGILWFTVTYCVCDVVYQKILYRICVVSSGLKKIVNN